jgi:hypothetical protein
MSSLSYVNPPQHNTMRVSVVMYWNCMQVVMGFIPGQNKFFNVFLQMQCYFLFYKELRYQSCVFFQDLLMYIIVRAYNKWHCVTPTSQVQEIEKHDVRVPSSGMMSIPIISIICSADIELNYVDR